MIMYKVIYDEKENVTNIIKEVVKYFKNSDKANAFFQEVKNISFSTPTIEIITEKRITK